MRDDRAAAWRRVGGDRLQRPYRRFAPAVCGAWTLDRIERRDANGELLSPPIENRLGYIIYDASGHMGVTIMRPDRQPYSEGGPTLDEALALIGTYTQISLHRLFYVGMIVGGDAGSGWVGATVDVRGLSGRIS